MPSRHFILATAGHVDHGKSSLVKALTGTDPDRLPEEKARGITIELGFAHLDLTAPVGATDTRPMSVGIVDVPGHEDFVKNMVAGVGSIDLALLIVAADDGWMPQSEEHLQILSYLGVQRGVVALTKADLATNEAATVEAIHARLQGTAFEEAPIVPTSVLTGRGLAELKDALGRVFAGMPAPADCGKPRLPVDRVFTLKGIGTVVTGTLTGGTFDRGQAVVLQPSGKQTRLRALQSHGQDVERAGPGTRTALNVPDLDGGVSRGDVITIAELGDASDTLDVLLEKSGRLVPSAGAAPEAAGGARVAWDRAAARPLKEGTLVRVHLGSGNVSARVQLAEGGPLLPGARRLAQLRLDGPVFAVAGDRFILRDWSEQCTLAGGLVLDAEARRRGFHTEERGRFLAGPPRASPMRERSWRPFSHGKG